MANTSCQRDCERWIREVWLPAQLGQQFTERKVVLATGGEFKFDAVSRDASIIASISTSRALMSSGSLVTRKIMKLRADMLFHVLAGARRKLMIVTEECMYRLCVIEQERG